MDLIDSISSLQLFHEDDEIINVDEINWSDDETWLTKSKQPKNGELVDFFNNTNDTSEKNGMETINAIGISRIDESKYIDTRTFKRPKKRSINQEESYRIENEQLSLIDSDSVMFATFSSPAIMTRKHPEPVQFDLTQTTNSSYFINNNRNIGGARFEYLESVSPPSLLNSLCSSTFSTLMENSFIKNDPILREIRDTDYTQTVLLQDVEPILYQSITTENNFDENLDLNQTTTKNLEPDLNQTYPKLNQHCNNDDDDNSLIVNTTRTSKSSNSNKSNDNLLDQTITDETYRSKSPRLLNRRPLLDLNNSKIRDNDKINNINTTITNECEKKMTIPTTNSLNCSTDSETTEFMSISSGGSSSKESYKMLNMDGINAIVQMQERSLQVQSTPIVENRNVPFVINDNTLSPITSGNSNPELSSNNYVELDDINPIIETQRTLMRKPKTLTNRLQYTGAKIRSSHPNLKMMEDNTRTITTSGSSSSSSNNTRKTNLNTIGHTLKGSYTSLKPICTNLPVAPPPFNRAQTIIKEQNDQNPIKDDVDNNKFIKPQIPQRFSGLPRPISTGIPRPVSRIPAPKSARSVAKPVGLSARKP